jgi:hypothetical protein
MGVTKVYSQEESNYQALTSFARACDWHVLKSQSLLDSNFFKTFKYLALVWTSFIHLSVSLYDGAASYERFCYSGRSIKQKVCINVRVPNRPHHPCRSFRLLVIVISICYASTSAGGIMSTYHSTWYGRCHLHVTSEDLDFKYKSVVRYW